MKDWFHHGAGQTRYFEIPPVSVIKGKTQFISGRHRTAVLLRHLARAPLAFAMRDIGETDTEWIQRVALSPIAIDTLIELPDLPVSPSLP